MTSSRIITLVKRQLLILEKTLLFIAVTVPATTAVGYFFGPKPYLQNSPLFFEPIQGLVEKRDTLILIGWYLIATISCLSVFWQMFQQESSDIDLVPSSQGLSKIFKYVLLLIVVFNLFTDLDRQGTGNVPALTIREASISILFWSIVGLVWFRSRNFVLFFRSIIACVLLIRPLSVFLQTPSSLRDGWHFNFTANELAAPAAGMIPMADFVPWYTNLLGFPIAPILRLIPGESVIVILSWVLLLEAICLALPTVIAYRVAGSHAAFLSFLLVISLITARPSVNSYFQAFPIRSIFPCVLLAVLVLRVQMVQTFQFRTSLFFGALSGLALLNNLESGIPSLLALVFTTFLLYRSMKIFMQSLLSVLFGSFLIFGIYWILLISAGRTPNFRFLIVGLQNVQLGGYFQASMAVGGFHNVFVIFFVSGMVTSPFLFFRAQKMKSHDLNRIATFMAFSSSWGLIGMVYFSGRSYTSTLTSGSNYPLGLLAISAILWVFIDKQFLLNRLRQSPQNLHILPVLGISLFFYIATISLTRMDAVHVLRQAGIVWSEESTRTASLKNADERIDRLKDDFQNSPLKTGQILPLSNILELTSGIEAGLVVSDPRYLSMFPAFRTMQCQFIIDSEFDLIIEEFALDDRFHVFTNENPNGSLKNLPNCGNFVEIEDNFLLGVEFRTRVLRVKAIRNG